MSAPTTAATAHGPRARITLGGRDIRDLPLADLRDMVAVVAQDTYLFHRSVRRNLQLARTGAGDDELEAEIHQALDELTRGRTTLVIAHRLSTVRGADRIVVMDGGGSSRSVTTTSCSPVGGATRNWSRRRR